MLNSVPKIVPGNQDVFPIAGQLSQAIHAGLPLESGLRALAEQTPSAKPRQALLELSQYLEQGMPLDEALQATKTGLPRQMQVLVKAGIESGRLDSLLRYSLEQLQRASSLRQSILLSMSYPVFVIWFATLICGSILVEIVPSFRKIFDDFGTELPVMTKALIELSSIVSFVGWKIWLLLMYGGMGFYVVTICFGMTTWGQRLMAALPIIGRVFRYAALTDFCQILAAMSESGLSLSKSLRFAGESSDDRWLRRQCQLLADDVDQGTPPANAANLAGLPNSLCQAFRESSSERVFVPALRGLSEVFAAQCNVSSQVANTVLGQFAATVVVAFVGLVAISLFMPLIKLLNDLS